MQGNISHFHYLHEFSSFSANVYILFYCSFFIIFISLFILFQLKGSISIQKAGLPAIERPY